MNVSTSIINAIKTPKILYYNVSIYFATRLSMDIF